MSLFHQKLWDLLPPLYRACDNGDLLGFLGIPAPSLDELHQLALNFPKLFDVDQCPDRFLPMLGTIVGYTYDPLRDAAGQRRDIREAIEFYRRKGTVPAIRRSLAQMGWRGHVTETFRQALRLNQRAKLNRYKLPGRFYSLGVYHLISDTVTPGLETALTPHHPAGTRAFFCQRLVTCSDLETAANLEPHVVATWCNRNAIEQVLRLNQNRLNDPLRHLTQWRRTYQHIRLEITSATYQNMTAAGVCMAAWLVRPPRFRLNRSQLNGQGLPNVWVNHLKYVVAWDVETREPELAAIPLRLNIHRLNQTRLIDARSRCSIKFRQLDMVGVVCLDLQHAGSQLTASHWPEKWYLMATATKANITHAVNTIAESRHHPPTFENESHAHPTELTNHFRATRWPGNQA